MEDDDEDDEDEELAAPKTKRQKEKEMMWKEWEDGVERALWALVDHIAEVRAVLKKIKEEGVLLRTEVKATRLKLMEVVKGISDIGQNVLEFTDLWRELVEEDEEDEEEEDEGLEDVATRGKVKDAKRWK